MRLWSLHPRYLDATGLVALWREALLAREVLRGRTTGYRHHPQLQRFRASLSPRASINRYLAGVYAEADSRGYRFDRTELGRTAGGARIAVAAGQLQYEWQWLMQKLARRSPSLHVQHIDVGLPDVHPLFRRVAGPVAQWENVRPAEPR